ncbi:hypothetical protein M9Y10_036519 [Tritrichomonas musculus]|uniref:Right handed beta helix domain-containing protein n=1 Tax=Tritrichomonas musculus TaxID=1915356 RepID=A0ABR2GUH6_9EUKA
MNLTIISLFASSLFLSDVNGISTMSPFFSITKPTIFQLDRSIFSRRFSPIISFTGYTQKILTRSSFLISLSEDRFSFFLSNAIKLTSNEVEITGDQNSQRFQATSGTTNVIVKKCIFNNMADQYDGGAIYINLEVNAQIQSTVFDNMKANHYGGAIFYQNLNDKSYTNDLYSNYNCFSDCNALYGTAIHGMGKTIQIYYSGTTTSKSEGAQMDINSDYIMSSHLNLTGGVSTYAGGMEYRHATRGKFQFQTLIGFYSCFTMALTETGTGLLVSDSNIVKCTLTNNPSEARPAIYFQNRGMSTASNFHVIGCSVRNAYNKDRSRQGKFSSCQNDNGEQGGETSIIDLTTDLEKSDVEYGNSKIIVSGNMIYGSLTATTLDIKQLNLGECQGDEVAPDMIEPTPTETLHPTVTATPMATVTATPKATVTATPKATVTATPKATVTATPKPTVTATPKATATEVPHGTPMATESPTQSLHPTKTPTPKATASPNKSPSLSPHPTQTTIPPATFPSNFFSESNFFTESEPFVPESGGNARTGLTRRKIIFIICISIFIFLLILIIIIIITCFMLRRAHVQNFTQEEEEEKNETNENNSSDYEGTNVFEIDD